MSETPTYPDLFGSSLQANGQLPSFFERRPFFGFQATPVVQDVCTDEDDPKETPGVIEIRHPELSKLRAHQPSPGPWAPSRTTMNGAQWLGCASDGSPSSMSTSTNYGTKDLGTLQLLAALQILQRGDLSLREMIGGYDGEIGQTQLLPTCFRTATQLSRKAGTLGKMRDSAISNVSAIDRKSSETACNFQIYC